MDKMLAPLQIDDDYFHGMFWKLFLDSLEELSRRSGEKSFVKITQQKAGDPDGSNGPAA